MTLATIPWWIQLEIRIECEVLRSQREYKVAYRTCGVPQRKELYLNNKSNTPTPLLTVLGMWSQVGRTWYSISRRYLKRRQSLFVRTDDEQSEKDRRIIGCNGNDVSMRVCSKAGLGPTSHSAMAASQFAAASLAVSSHSDFLPDFFFPWTTIFLLPHSQNGRNECPLLVSQMKDAALVPSQPNLSSLIPTTGSDHVQTQFAGNSRS